MSKTQKTPRMLAKTNPKAAAFSPSDHCPHHCPPAITCHAFVVQDSKDIEIRQCRGSWKRNGVYEMPESKTIQAWSKYMRTIVNEKHEKRMIDGCLCSSWLHFAKMHEPCFVTREWPLE